MKALFFDSYIIDPTLKKITTSLNSASSTNTANN